MRLLRIYASHYAIDLHECVGLHILLLRSAKIPVSNGRYRDACLLNLVLGMADPVSSSRNHQRSFPRDATTSSPPSLHTSSTSSAASPPIPWVPINTFPNISADHSQAGTSNIPSPLAAPNKVGPEPAMQWNSPQFVGGFNTAPLSQESHPTLTAAPYTSNYEPAQHIYQPMHPQQPNPQTWQEPSDHLMTGNLPPRPWTSYEELEAVDPRQNEVPYLRDPCPALTGSA